MATTKEEVLEMLLNTQREVKEAYEENVRTVEKVGGPGYVLQLLKGEYEMIDNAFEKRIALLEAELG